MSMLPKRVRDTMAVIGRYRKIGIDAPRRHLINVTVFLLLSAVLVVYVALSLLFVGGGARTINMEFADVAGVNIRNDVTMRGVPVGLVSDFRLTPRGTVMVKVTLDTGVTVPDGTSVIITRRSAIGDVTVEMTPGTGPPIPNGGTIPLSRTKIPPDPERTIEILTRLVHAIPSEELHTVVSELAAAVRGRGEDLATISVAGADLSQRLVQVQTQLESLIRNGPKVTGVLAAHADTLADDIARTAVLADILRDRRFDLVTLSQNAASFAEIANEVILKDKANLSCLISDLGAVNADVAQPENLENFELALKLNHFFFDGVELSVTRGKDGLDWFRVQLLQAQQPPANSYEPHRPIPGVYPGNACRSIYGSGVGPVTQRTDTYLAPESKLHPGH